MAKLIEASGLLEQVVRIQASEQEPEKKVGQIIMAIANAPTVDAAPVVRGRWKRRGRNLGECSECVEIVMVRYPYCPNCGAKMDGGDGR